MTSSTDDRRTTVIVIGAGITGIGCAHALEKNGISYRILEKNDDVGGTWYTQRWHGVRCDSDMFNYSFSFNHFASDEALHSGSTIQRYLVETARQFGIHDRIEFETRVEQASFDTETTLWTVRTSRGVYRCEFLINGNGYYSDKPHIPDIPDMDRFEGELLHTFDLNEQLDFEGKRVVLLGSGSTAVACAPALAPRCGSLTILQRSPSYIWESDRRTGLAARVANRLYRWGLRWPSRFVRFCITVKNDLNFVLCRFSPSIGRWLLGRQWRSRVGQKLYDAHFRPNYGPWEQRVCISTGLAEQVRRGEIQMVTDEVARFEGRALILKSGARLECDAVVLATGFNLQFMKTNIFVDGVKIEVGGASYFKHVMFGGVPNYFHPAGYWHSTWTERIELIADYIVAILRYMDKHRLSRCWVPSRPQGDPPTISPNYVKRAMNQLPRSHGTYDLPSVDRFLSYRFHPREHRFA